MGFGILVDKFSNLSEYSFQHTLVTQYNGSYHYYWDDFF